MADEKKADTLEELIFDLIGAAQAAVPFAARGDSHIDGEMSASRVAVNLSVAAANLQAEMTAQKRIKAARASGDVVRVACGTLGCIHRGIGCGHRSE